MHTKPRIAVIDGQWKKAFYRNVVDAVDADWMDVTGVDAHKLSECGIDLVLLNDERGYYASLMLPQLHEGGIPSLHMMDGILEWRNCTERLAGTMMPICQPSLASKVACIGKVQLRLLRHWGNAGKLELTGAPRLDCYNNEGASAVGRSESNRLLVMTANTPAFSDYERSVVLQSLIAVKEEVKEARLAGLNVDVAWRVEKGLLRDLRLEATGDSISGGELRNELSNCRAVICTPSTAALEAMLVGVPVALLDFLNCPHFDQLAWRFTAREHLRGAIQALFFPSPARMDYQQFLLHESLECRGPSTPRMATLISEMIDAGRAARSAGIPLLLPSQILPGTSTEPAPRHMAALFPAESAFRERSVSSLQMEVGHLRKANQDLQRRLSRNGVRGLLKRIARIGKAPEV